jgi:hypothetical protein
MIKKVFDWKTTVPVNSVALFFTSKYSLLIALKELLKSVSAGFAPMYNSKVQIYPLFD